MDTLNFLDVLCRVYRLQDGHTWLTASEEPQRQSSQRFPRLFASIGQVAETSGSCRRRRRMRPIRTSTTCSSCSSSATAASARRRSSSATPTILSLRHSSAQSASTSKSKPCSSKTNASNYRSGYCIVRAWWFNLSQLLIWNLRHNWHIINRRQLFLFFSGCKMYLSPASVVMSRFSKRNYYRSFWPRPLTLTPTYSVFVAPCISKQIVCVALLVLFLIKSRFWALEAPKFKIKIFVNMLGQITWKILVRTKCRFPYKQRQY